MITIPRNEYGTVDIRNGIPKGCAHFPGMRLQLTCRSIGIEFAQAMTGFKKHRGFYRPVFDGVIVLAKYRRRMTRALKAKAERNTPDKIRQRAMAREKKWEAQVVAVSSEMRRRFPSMPEGEEIEITKRAWSVGSGRVGRSSTADDPIMAAVVAHVRHNYTDYDELLNLYRDRDMARGEVTQKIASIIREWSAENRGSDKEVPAHAA